jgi:hypothetical protein
MGQKALFVSVVEVKKKSIISGSVDPDKIVQFVEVAQDTHIQNYLGGKLYNKMQQLILDDEISLPINSNYLHLLETYIKPMLIWFTQADYIPFSAFQVSNGGVFRHTAANSQVASMEEINMLTRTTLETAEFYTRRFMDYMDFNSELFPEYTSTANEEMHPDKDVNFGGIYLG